MEECELCFEAIDSKCQFSCQHQMCLMCFIEYSKSQHICHICRQEIEYNKINYGGDQGFYFSGFDGTIRTLNSINLEKMMCTQLYRIVELRLFGRYFDDLRLIFSGRQLARNDVKLCDFKPNFGHYSTLDCVLKLKAD